MASKLLSRKLLSVVVGVAGIVGVNIAGLIYSSEIVDKEVLVMSVGAILALCGLQNKIQGDIDKHDV